MEVGSVADWFGAIGTIAAVVVALFTRKNDKKPNLLFYCESQENTSNYVLKVQNNSNEMVCLVPKKRATERYILWPVGTVEKNKNESAIINSVNSATLSVSSVKVIESSFPRKGKKTFIYYDTISKCYYKVIVECADGIPSVLSYSSFYCEILLRILKYVPDHSNKKS